MFVSKEFIKLKHEKILSHDVAYQGDFFLIMSSAS